jgi:hypothetical protein
MTILAEDLAELAGGAVGVGGVKTFSEEAFLEERDEVLLGDCPEFKLYTPGSRPLVRLSTLVLFDCV